MPEYVSSNSNFFSWLEASARYKAGLMIRPTLASKLIGLILERNHRKQLKLLLDATPEHLADIGITRGTLRQALKLPLNQSAAGWLSENTVGKKATFDS